MTREKAANHALRAIELERDAIKHCDRLDNPDYIRLISESVSEKMKAESFFS